jgi:hypothetical protein
VEVFGDLAEQFEGFANKPKLKFHVVVEGVGHHG